MKTLILYVFHEINYRVYYFIENAIFESEDYTFMLICNNKDIEFKCPKYVKILKRDNIGYDFGAWSDGLLTNDLYKSYDKFIFINSSCIGPFLPSYFSGNWCDIFINQIDDEIKLVGTTINTIDSISTKSHVQSWLFCTDKLGLNLLIEKSIFSNKKYEIDHHGAIYNREIPMSRVIIENKWNIACLMKYYQDVDFREKENKKYSVTGLGDIAFNISYLSNNISPYEVVFVKGNRNYDKNLLDVYYKKNILKKKIVKAIYGCDKYVEVTGIVNFFVEKTFKITNLLFGDPNPYTYKQLIILDDCDNVIVIWENNFYCQKYIVDDSKSYYLDILARH